MTQINTNQLWMPFSDSVDQSQQTFRLVMKALAEPGTLVNLGAVYQQNTQPKTAMTVQPKSLAAFSLMLTLLDQETSLWISPTLSSEVLQDNLKFHTGARLVTQTDMADFAYLTLAELSDSLAFKPGSDEYPNESATLIVEVDALDVEVTNGDTQMAQAQMTLRLTGPGIKTEKLIAVAGCQSTHLQWIRENHLLFPMGLDLLLVCGDSLLAIPRSTKVDECTANTSLVDTYQRETNLCMSR